MRQPPLYKMSIAVSLTYRESNEEKEEKKDRVFLHFDSQSFGAQLCLEAWRVINTHLLIDSVHKYQNSQTYYSHTVCVHIN